jgi:ATP-binding cassette, subfamily B, heavy metal transporter
MPKNKKKKVHYKYNFRLYFNLLKKYKWLFISVLVLILILESLYIIDKLLFKLIIDKGTDFNSGTLDVFNFQNILLGIAAVYISVYLIRSIGRWFEIHIINHLEANLIRDLKKKFFNHILHLSHNFHTSNKTGSLISRLIRGGRAVESMTDILTFHVAPLLFQLIAVSLSLLYFNWVSSLILFLTVTIFIGSNALIFYIQRKAIVYSNQVEDREKATIADIFINIDSIKYFGKERLIKRLFRDKTEKTKKSTLWRWGYHRWTSALQGIILNTGVVLLMYFPLMDFLNGEITIGTLTFIYTVYGNMIGPMYGFIHGIRRFYGAMADFEDLFKYNKVHNDIKEPADAKKCKLKHGTIDFNNISFAYHKRNIIKNFKLNIKKDQKIALVGRSGSGKSTLINLLYRLYDVNEGEILVDNKNINTFQQESLRSEMSIVPQECILFDDTIYNNIKFSRPTADREEVMKAIKKAQLDNFIKELPQKERTVVGERGVKLSGGEKQRVSIARALLADKKILVLDEATSSLDSETEHKIQSSLKRLMKGRTTIMIAHRLSTIMQADKIIVLDKGKIVQSGTHRQLSKEKGPYKKFWNLQKGGYIK